MILRIATVVLILSTNAYADPLYQAAADNAIIVLHNDKCTLTQVKNLPHRVTWTEGGKVTEGCWIGRPDSGVVVAYFADLTAVAIPIPMFAKVTGI